MNRYDVLKYCIAIICNKMSLKQLISYPWQSLKELYLCFKVFRKNNEMNFFCLNRINSNVFRLFQPSDM